MTHCYEDETAQQHMKQVKLAQSQLTIRNITDRGQSE